MPVVTPSPAHPPSMNPIWVSITRMGQLLVSLPFVTGWAGGVLSTGAGLGSVSSGRLRKTWRGAQPRAPACSGVTPFCVACD
jgi:hypothetical protein